MTPTRGTDTLAQEAGFRIFLERIRQSVHLMTAPIFSKATLAWSLFIPRIQRRTDALRVHDQTPYTFSHTAPALK